MNRYHRYILLLVCLLLAKFIDAQQGQISIPRVDLMPDQPSPFSMRDWKNVAIQYDSFIYNKYEPTSAATGGLTLGFVYKIGGKKK